MFNFCLVFFLIHLIISSHAWCSVMDTELFTRVADKVISSVVNLSTSSTVDKSLLPPFPMDEFLPGGPKPTMKIYSLGSGIVIDPKGIILTNNHVVGKETDVKILFTESFDEIPAHGKVIARDADLDLALVQTSLPTGITVAQLGDSDQLKVGEFLLTVGNPFGQGHSMSHGILSAKGRFLSGTRFGGFLQTDAPINPGNSGGPLVNMKGEVVGINTAVQFNAQGIGYAIPINPIKDILSELKNKGKIEHPYLGMMIEPLTESIASQLGVSKHLSASVITAVYEDSPSFLIGIKPYDIVIGLNGKESKSPLDLIMFMSNSKVGDLLEIKVIRKGKEKKFQIKLVSRPDSEFDRNQKQEFSNSFIHSKTGMRLEKNLGEEGVFITGIASGGLADSSGLFIGDIIIEFDQIKIKNLEQFKQNLSNPGKHLLRVIRNKFGKDIYTLVEIDLG
jgi:serine protease Do